MRAPQRPVLLRLLPSLTDVRVVATVGRHLKRWEVRHIDGSSDVVLSAYESWCRHAGEVGWVLGDTLAFLADRSKADILIRLSSDATAERARACIVDSLWRFKSTHDVEGLLADLVRDPDGILGGHSASTDLWTGAFVGDLARRTDDGVQRDCRSCSHAWSPSHREEACGRVSRD